MAKKLVRPIVDELPKENFKEQITQIVDKQTAEFIDRLPKLIDDILQSSVASLIGVDRRFNGYDIKHNSPLCGLVNGMVNDAINSQLNGYIKESILTLSKNERFMDSLLKQIGNNFSYEFKKAVDRLTSEIAKESAIQAAAKFVSDADLFCVNDDLEDPNGHKTETSKKMLYEKLKKMVDSNKW